jgi:glycerate kinase
MADGGEGSLETIAASLPRSQRIQSSLGGGAIWLLLEDGTALVELANLCGLSQESRAQPLRASTFRLGVVINEALADQRVNRLVIAVGGSGSTDGGVGALIALGAKFLSSTGAPISLGGAGLLEISKIDLSEVPAPPSRGIICLTDVTNPLLGALGSARIFAPQKGANAPQVELLEAGLALLMEVSGAPDFAGAGAAGGTPFGLNLPWKVEIESGALAIAGMIGVEPAIWNCDLVITGEGRLDAQSFFGKVVGTITELTLKAQRNVLYCVGSSEEPLDEKGIALTELAPTAQEAMESAEKWLISAGAELARRQSI